MVSLSPRRSMTFNSLFKTFSPPSRRILRSCLIRGIVVGCEVAILSRQPYAPNGVMRFVFNSASRKPNLGK